MSGLNDAAKEAREHADACTSPYCHRYAHALAGAMDAQSRGQLDQLDEEPELEGIPPRCGASGLSRARSNHEPRSPHWPDDAERSEGLVGERGGVRHADVQSLCGTGIRSYDCGNHDAESSGVTGGPAVARRLRHSPASWSGVEGPR